MTTIKALCARHVEAWKAFRHVRASAGTSEAKRVADEAVNAITRHVCTSEADACELYNHLLWYSLVDGDQMQPHARALLAAMRHTPGPALLTPTPANDWRHA